MRYARAACGAGVCGSGLVRRTLQAAVLMAVGATVPAGWGAGNAAIQVSNVAAGAASFSQAGSITTVRTYSQNTIINYQQLNVNAGETLQFLQPNATSRVLNRIQGIEPSVIDGTITSNGIVYLVNPAGVMFGPGAVVSASGFFAAGSHISDQSFLAGLNQFTNSTGAVANSGTLSAVQVHLVGVQVANFGQIIAGDAGLVTMTAGKDVFIGTTNSPASAPHVFVRVSNDTASTNNATGVTNAGSVKAGQIQLGAGDMYAAGIYNSGVLKGKAITLDSHGNSDVSTGTIDASNSNGVGGSVQILGDKVGVGGTVDASGTSGGGTIRIGGDEHGGSELPAASQTNIGSGAVIRADATVSGNGGSVVVWSNDVTRFFGVLSAQGGPLGGNGGSVEVSSKNDLVFAGSVNTLAPMGTAGTLLLDPSSITVDDTVLADFTDLTQVNDFSLPDSGGNVMHTDIIDAATTNVVLQATGNVTINSAVVMSNVGVGLTVQAGGNIIVNNSITTQGGALVLSAGDQTPGAGGPGNPGSASGSIALNGFALSTTGGGQSGADITLRTSAITVSAGAQIMAGTGTVAFEPNVAGSSVSVGSNSGSLAVTTEVLGDIVSAGTIRFGSAAAGDITLTGTAGVLDFTALACNITLQNQTTHSLDFNGTDIKLAAGQTLTIIGSSGIIANGAGFSVESSGGTVVFQNVGGDIGSAGQPFTAHVGNLGGATEAAPSNIYFVNTGQLTVSGAVTLSNPGSNSIIGAASPVIVNADITLGGSFTLQAGDNAAAPGDNLTIAANVSSTSGGTITLIAGDNVLLNSGTISTAGGVSITANHENDLTDGDTGSITQQAGNSILATVLSVAATTGISLNSAGNAVAGFEASNTGTGATGGISLVNTGAAGLALVLGVINQGGTGDIAITTTGAVTQVAAITASAGANLKVTTQNDLGAAITLDQANDLGSGSATLLVHDSADAFTVAAPVTFSTSGPMHIGRIESGDVVTLSAPTIDQDLADAVGISAATLNVTSGGATTLTNANNNFASLSVTDFSSGGLLQYTTNAPGGLTITGFTQTGGGTAVITNTSGAVTSTADLVEEYLTVNAAGGIALTSDNNVFQTVTVSNTTSGDINIHQGAGMSLPLVIEGLAQSGGGATFLTSGLAVVIDGTVAAGAGLTIRANNAAGGYQATSAAAITVAGDVLIVADAMLIDPASTLNAGVHNVTLEPFTPSVAIGLGAADGAGVLGLTSDELATITAGRVIIGSILQSGDITGTGTINLPASVQLITTGNVDLSGATITSAAASGFSLEVDHDGTFLLADATIDGGLTEFGSTGSGPGGLVTLSGTLTTPNDPLTFNSSVAIFGVVSIVTKNGGSGGATVTFAALDSTGNGDDLSIDAGTGDVHFNQAIGSHMNMGILTVLSANDISVQSAIAVGEDFTNSGVLTINGLQSLGASGFTQTGASSVQLKGDIVTAGTAPLTGTITLNSPVVVTGSRTLDTTNGGATAGADITLNGMVTGGAADLAVVAGGGDVAVNAAITTGGAFSSSGAAFGNGADISTLSITLDHSGLVTLNGGLIANAGAGDVAIGGAGVTQNAGIINAGTLALTGHGTFTLAQNNTVGTLAADVTGGLTFVNAGGLAVSSAGSPTVHGITTNDGLVNITVNTGDLTITQPIAAGAGMVTLAASAGSVVASADISGGAVTVTASVNMVVGNVTTTGGDITLDPLPPPASITLNGDLNAGAGDVMVTSATIFIGNDITVTGANVTFGGTVDGASHVGHGLIVDASTLTTFQGDVGDTTPLTSLTVNAPGSTSLNGSITAGAVEIDGPLTLTANSVITASTGSATFGDVITGGGLYSLDVAAAAGSTFTGTIGQPAGSELTEFSVSGGAATFLAPTVTTLGDQTYNAAVLVGANATFSGVNISFNSSLNTSGGVWSLGIDASGAVMLAGPTGSALDPFSTLTISGATGTTIATSVNTSGDINAPGPVTVSGNSTSSGGNIFMSGAITLGGDAVISAGGEGMLLGNIMGAHGLTLVTTGAPSGTVDPIIIVGTIGTVGSPIGALKFDSALLVHLGGDIYANSVTFGGSDGGDLASIPTVATISYAGGDLTIDTTGAFTMKFGQKLSVFNASQANPALPNYGNLVINTNNHPLTVEDISANGSVTLNYGSSALTVLARAPSQVLLNDGTQVVDQGTSVLSGIPGGLHLVGISKSIIIDAAPGLPAGTLVQLASPTGQADLSGFFAASGVTVLKVNQTDPVTVAQFEAVDYSSSFTVLDVKAFGISSAVNAVGVFVTPRVDFTVQTELTALDAAQRDSLRELGVFARDPRISEILDYLIGHAIYDDVPYMLNPSPQDQQVVSNRLPYSPVIQTVDTFRALFFKTVTDEHGKPQLQAQDTNIRNALGQAWQLYMTMARRDQATPERFRAFLEAVEGTEPKAAKALVYLNQLRDLLAKIQTLGLTQTEFEVSQKVLLAKVRPANIKEADFLAAVNGPSSKTQGSTP